MRRYVGQRLLGTGAPNTLLGLVRFRRTLAEVHRARYLDAIGRDPERNAALMTEVAADTIRGEVAPGFEEVRTEFERNFIERGEVGAACAAYYRGRKVVDLWGGYRDERTRDPWKADTLVLVFSVTKGMSAIAMAVARSRGLIDYDERVATYWPEFAQNGKERITVRQVLDHESGVSTVDEQLTAAKMADRHFIAATIARQRPAWDPGTRRGYHYLTVGWIEAELIRRVDPGHRTLSRFFQDEIAGPLGLEFYIGLPSSVPPARVATIKAFHGLRMLLHMNTLPRGMVLAFFRPGSLTSRTLANPRLNSPGTLDSAEFRTLGLPAAGGIGQVRDIAKAFGVLATGGQELGITPETMADLAAPARVPAGGPEDLVWHANLAFSLGFIKPSSVFRFGTSDNAFGSEGAGGSFAFADPDVQLGFAYAPNRLGFHLLDDPREKSLRDALYRCLASTSSRGAPGL